MQSALASSEMSSSTESVALLSLNENREKNPMQTIAEMTVGGDSLAFLTPASNSDEQSVLVLLFTSGPKPAPLE